MIKHAIRLTILLFALGPMADIGRPGDLQTFTNVTLVANGDVNDGDSFLADLGDRKIHARLYFVDCPETRVQSEADIRRVQEQQRYFGLPDERLVIHYGEKAASFTTNRLADPFTVHTSFASALGRSPMGRVYVFVTTAEGRDLGRLLVREGFARAHGVGRAGPEGTHRDEWKQQLEDLEVAAAHGNRGIWADTDSDQLATLRALQRREENQLDRIRDELLGLADIDYPLNVNTSTIEELQTIRGIGPVLAGRIIENRPYSNYHDLSRVSGIGGQSLSEWENLLTTDPPEDNPAGSSSEDHGSGPKP